MASFCRQRKFEADARRDVISELPANVKEMILECLPTRDAARTALLSTQWKDAWLRLEFDLDFFRSVRESKGDSAVPFVKVITYILLQRVRPVKKFSLSLGHSLSAFNPKLEHSDLDQWFLFLSRNGVEELEICMPSGQYKLPFCIVSCPTLKHLRLSHLGFDCPINAPSIFPCVISLDFSFIRFDRIANGIVYNLPNLEELYILHCRADDFKINAPKLQRLSIFCTSQPFKLRRHALHFEAIKVLCLDDFSLLVSELDFFPTAINLEVIKLDSIRFDYEKQLRGVLQLLQKSPNLCELDIKATPTEGYMDDEEQVFLRLLKDPDSCIVNQDLKMLKTVKIKTFCGSNVEMLFVEMLLSKSPTLERVFISEFEYVREASNVIRIQRELLCLPRASPKAQIVYMGKDYA